MENGGFRSLSKANVEQCKHFVEYVFFIFGNHHYGTDVFRTGSRRLLAGCEISIVWDKIVVFPLCLELQYLISLNYSMQSFELSIPSLTITIFGGVLYSPLVIPASFVTRTSSSVLQCTRYSHLLLSYGKASTYSIDWQKPSFWTHRSPCPNYSEWFTDHWHCWVLLSVTTTSGTELWTSKERKLRVKRINPCHSVTKTSPIGLLLHQSHRTILSIWIISNWIPRANQSRVDVPKVLHPSATEFSEQSFFMRFIESVANGNVNYQQAVINGRHVVQYKICFYWVVIKTIGSIVFKDRYDF